MFSKSHFTLVTPIALSNYIINNSVQEILIWDLNVIKPEGHRHYHAYQTESN